MKIAFRTHDLGVDGVIAAVEKCAACGIEAVQLVPYKFIAGLSYAPGVLGEEFTRRIGEAFASAGVAVPLIGAYFNPVHSDGKKVQNSIAVFKEYLKYAKNLGGDIVGSETGSFNDDKWTYNPLNRTEEAFQRVVGTFSYLCECAKEYGVNVGIEGASGHVMYDVKTLKRAVDEINADNLKVIFDIYNLLDGENYNRYLEIFDEGLKAFAGKIVVFHVKDCVFSDGKLKQVAPGKGMFDFDEILKRIKAYDENAVLVLEGTTGDDIVPCSEFIKEKWRNL